MTHTLNFNLSFTFSFARNESKRKNSQGIGRQKRQKNGSRTFHRQSVHRQSVHRQKKQSVHRHGHFIDMDVSSTSNKNGRFIDKPLQQPQQFPRNCPTLID